MLAEKIFITKVFFFQKKRKLNGMSFQSQELESKYLQEVSNRRIKDGVWDFLHGKDSPKTRGWVQGAINCILDDFSEQKAPDGTVLKQELLKENEIALLHKLAAGPYGHFHYALWIVCLVHYQNMVHFFTAKNSCVSSVDRELLERFLVHRVPPLVQEWLEGVYIDTKSWVRHMRMDYSASVPCNSHLPLSNPTAFRLQQ